MIFNHYGIDWIIMWITVYFLSWTTINIFNLNSIQHLKWYFIIIIMQRVEGWVLHVTYVPYFMWSADFCSGSGYHPRDTGEKSNVGRQEKKKTKSFRPLNLMRFLRKWNGMTFPNPTKCRVWKTMHLISHLRVGNKE